jgi:hypothetical protein
LISLTHRLLLVSVSFWFLLSPCAVAAQSPVNDRKFIDDTKGAYSMLRRQGLGEISATVSPNWDLVFADLEPAKRPQALAIARRLRFSLFADSNGTVRVTHTLLGPKLSGPKAEAIKTIAKGIELSVTGFLMTWMPFMMTYLIPDQLDQFILQDLKSIYLLTFTERNIEVGVKVTKDFVITELTTPQGSIKPSLLRNPNGFVLTGYEGINEDPVVGRIVLKAKIDSAPVRGMLLPRLVWINGSAAAKAFNLKFFFTNYKFKTNRTNLSE